MQTTGGTWRRWAPAIGAILLLAVALLPGRSSATASGAVPGTWSLTGSMSTARSSHTATLLPNGQVLVAGGCCDSNGNSLASAELYDPSTGIWRPTGTMSTAREGHTATLLPNGQVLVAAGESCTKGSGCTFLSSAELYNPSTGTWTPTASMLVTPRAALATLLPNGEVLIADNFTAELYDPSTGTWLPTGNCQCSPGTATLLPNGQVLDAGGGSSSAELYNPNGGVWTPTGSMSVPRSGHTATLLPNGQVLVAGGCAGLACTSAELYNPSTGTWTPTSSMTTARWGAMATLLPSGQALIISGYVVPYYNSVATAELYSPGTATWTPTGPMVNAHPFGTATLLPNGQVLVAGGQANCTSTCAPLASAELYAPIAVPPTLAVTPTSGSYGQTVTLTGTNFGAKETVGLYGDSYAPGKAPFTATTTTASGAFGLSFPILQAAYGSHTFIAVGQTSGLSATAPFFITPSTVLQHSSGVPGTPNVLTGYGFGANEVVTAHWMPGGTLLGHATTNARGTFTSASAITFTVPLSPTGTYSVEGVGQSSHAFATSPFTVTPSLTITPRQGVRGSTATVSGRGYGAHEAVTVRWSCATSTCISTTILASKVTDGSGSFSTLVRIPTTTTLGPHVLGGKGNTTNAFASTSFTVSS